MDLIQSLLQKFALVLIVKTTEFKRMRMMMLIALILIAPWSLVPRVRMNLFLSLVAMTFKSVLTLVAAAHKKSLL